MPAIYSIISFFSYRYFRTYTYYHLALVVYESIVVRVVSSSSLFESKKCSYYDRLQHS